MPIDNAGCERGYHTACVGLDEVPADDWLCPECEEAQQARSAAARRRSGRGASSSRAQHTQRAQRAQHRRLRRGAGTAAVGSDTAVDLVSSDEATLEEWQGEQGGRSSESDDDDIDWAGAVAGEAADLRSGDDGSSALRRRASRRAAIAQLNAREHVPESAVEEGAGRGAEHARNSGAQARTGGAVRRLLRGGQLEPRLTRYDDLQRVRAS